MSTNAVPRRDMTQVAVQFPLSHPAPRLPDHVSAEVVHMNAVLWDLIDATLFRAKVALAHHGYAEVVGEINGAVAEVAEAWGALIDREDGQVPAPRVLVIDEVVPPGVMPRGMWRGSSVTWAAADLVVDRTGRVLKWRYGATEVTR